MNEHVKELLRLADNFHSHNLNDSEKTIRGAAAEIERLEGHEDSVRAECEASCQKLLAVREAKAEEYAEEQAKRIEELEGKLERWEYAVCDNIAAQERIAELHGMYTMAQAAIAELERRIEDLEMELSVATDRRRDAEQTVERLRQRIAEPTQLTARQQVALKFCVYLRRLKNRPACDDEANQRAYVMADAFLAAGMDGAK